MSGDEEIKNANDLAEILGGLAPELPQLPDLIKDALEKEQDK